MMSDKCRKCNAAEKNGEKNEMKVLRRKESKQIKGKYKTVSDEWGLYSRQRGKTDRARPTVEARQNDRPMRGEERDTSQGREQ